jgi:hypothetical protein
MDFSAEDIDQAAVFEKQFGRLFAAGHRQFMVHVSHDNSGTLQHPASGQNKITIRNRRPALWRLPVNRPAAYTASA